MPTKDSTGAGGREQKGDRYAAAQTQDPNQKTKRVARKPGPRKTPRYRFRDFAMI